MAFGKLGARGGFGSAGNLGRASDPFSGPVTPGQAGFLATTSAVFDYVNYMLQSNAFSTTPWGEYHNVVAARTLASGQAANPVDATVDAWKLTLPAVTGANAASIIYQTLSGTGTRANNPSVTDIYIKGVNGGETIWIAIQLADNTFVSRTKFTDNGTWQRISVAHTRHATLAQTLHIGVNLADSSQTATPAQSVYIYGAQNVQDTVEWPYVATTTVQSANQQSTLALPAGIAFRDYSALSASPGTNVVPQNTFAWNVHGTDSPKIVEENKIGSTYFSFTENNDGNATPALGWNNLAVYTGTGPTSFTSSAANPIISAAAGTWKHKYLLHPSTVKVGSLWYMYYSAQNSAGVSSIGLATASDPINGPWTDYGSNPIITGDGECCPYVIPIGSLLYMYVAKRASGTTTLGSTINVYTSPIADGIVWTPLAIALRQSVSDWDYTNRDPNNFIIEASVWKNSHGFYEMIYSTGQNPGASFIQSAGQAISADGKFWYKYQASSFDVGTSTPIHWVGDAVLFRSGSTLYYYYANVVALTDTQGFVRSMPLH